MARDQVTGPVGHMSLISLFDAVTPAAQPARKASQGKVKSKGAAHPTQAAPAVITVDPALDAFRMRSAPTYAPASSAEPYGVEALPTVSTDARLKANQAVRDILARGVTPADHAALRTWSGEGGLGEHSASTSAFYTPGELVQVAYDLSQALGSTRRILEFSCGGGAFLARAPKFSDVVGVELDETSAAVAQALHPHVTVWNASFETYTTQSEDAPFDLVIGNPPFGTRGAQARLHRPDLRQAHWYFVLEGLRRVTPGGLMTVVVPESMLRVDSDRPHREALIDLAHPLMLSAVPEGAFRAAGAGVTTVLLVLRRHDAGVTEALNALTHEEQAQLREQRLTHSGYLRQIVNGEGVFYRSGTEWKLQYAGEPLGTPRHQAKIGDGRFGDPVYPGGLRVDLETLTKQASARVNDILTLPGALAAIQTLLGTDVEARARRARPMPHPIADGTTSSCGTYRFQGSHWQYGSHLSNPAVLSALTVAQAITAARSGQQHAARDTALRLHDTHLSTHGAYDLTLLRRAAKSAPALHALVEANGDVPALLTELTDREPPITPGTIGEVAQQLEAYGLLTITSLARYAQVTDGDAAAHLLAQYAFTGHTWEAASTYYRGRAHEKARLAETLAADHTGTERQALLQQAQTCRERALWVDITDMTLEARDPLIPEHVLADWVNANLGTCVAVKRNSWDADGAPVNLIQATRGEHGVTLRLRNALDDELALKERQAISPGRVRELEAYLNFRTPVEPVVNQDVKTPEQITAERHAHQARAVQFERQLAAHFRTWLLGSEHVGTVELTLNEHRYGLLTATPDLRPLTLPRYQGPLAHPFQAGHVRAAARMDGVILDFSVGLGKTLTALMLAELLLQSGRARLPAVVVPLSRLGDWVMNAATALPGLRISVIGGEPVRAPDGSVALDEDGEPRVLTDTGDRRRAKIAALLTSPPDLVIMTYEAFEMIPMLEETRKKYVQSDETLMSALATTTTFDERHRKMGGHRALAAGEKFTQRHLGRVKVATSTDVPFEALGIDAVLWDEAHALKNTYAAPAVYGDSSPKFLGGGGESNRALDGNHKARFIRERGGCTVALSATWFTNSPLEIWNMLSLVTDALPAYGITNVQAFTARFCVIEPRLITLPEGDVEFRSCVVGFRNLDELRAIIGQHVIRETEDTCQMHDRVGMPLPPLTTVEHLFDLHPVVQDEYDAEQATISEAESDGEKHLFSIFSRLSKLTLHPPLMNVQAPNARFAACVEACLAARAQGGRNVVFMYTGGEGGMTYTALRDQLIAAGYPAGEIEIITASTHQGGERLTIERRFRRGVLTCVIGSSVIEQGGNYQGATDLHHLDYPHHHMAFVQRIGRGRRQGTWVKEIRNHVYFARGSFDVIRFQNMMGKKGWAQQVFDPTLTSCENTDVGFDGEELAVMLSRNPDATRQAIRAKREARQAESHAASLLADLTVIREYLEALSLLEKRDRTARSREHGPSTQDVAGINRLVTALRGLHGQVQALRAAANPMAALTRLQQPILWVEGLPIHAGLTFEHQGNPVTVRDLRGADTGIRVTDVGGNVDVIAHVDLARARHVQPTRVEGAYGAEGLTRLRAELQERILSAEVAPQTPAQPAVPIQLAPVPEIQPVPAVAAADPVGETMPTPRPAPAVRTIQRPPLRLRYGLTVTEQLPTRPAQVYAIQGDTLTPGAVDGCPLVIVEYRAERDVRMVTLVFPDSTRAAQTRTLLRQHDPRVRARMDQLLLAAI
ncbi:hypothetical protein GCM10008019_16120 [Deinococcus soli (ex Cha et al. 2016)]|nr:hypothetical protein GCM10008019_16120 [Deinococcus soli (ex Cha et al. 2016)]